MFTVTIIHVFSIFVGKSGYFPSDYVEIVKTVQVAKPQPPPVVAKPAPPAKLMARALFNFTGSSAVEMSFTAGETFEVVEKGPAGGWSRGKKGAFPTDYVEFLASNSTTQQAAPLGSIPLASKSTIPVAASDSRKPQPAATRKPSTTTSKADISSIFDGLDAPVSNATPQTLPFNGMNSLNSTNSNSTAPSLLDDLTGFPTVTNGRPATLKMSKPLDFSSPSLLDSFEMQPSNKSAAVTNLLDDFEPQPMASKPSSNIDLLFPTSTPYGAAQPAKQSVVAKEVTTKDSNLFLGLSSTSVMKETKTTSYSSNSGSNPFAAASETDPFAAISTESSSISVEKKTTSNLFSTTQTVPMKPSRQEATNPFGDSGDVIPKQPSYSVGKPPAKTSEFAIATFTREKQGDGEISIKEGETLLVLKKDGEWWYGSTLGPQSATGYFPSSYVELKTSMSVSTTTTVVKHDAAKVGSVYKRKTTSAETVAVQEDIPKCLLEVGLDGRRYVFDPLGATVAAPIWHMPMFLDLYADLYKRKLFENDSQLHVPAIQRMGHTCGILHRAVTMVNARDNTIEGFHAVVAESSYLLKDAMELCTRIPFHTDDCDRFFNFLVQFMARLKTMRSGTSMIIPSSWNDSANVEHAVILLVTKEADKTEYAVTLVNSGVETGKGLEYHPGSIDPTFGEVLRNMSLELHDIPGEKIQNTVFWYASLCHYSVVIF